jgi:hypothetical protein
MQFGFRNGWPIREWPLILNAGCSGQHDSESEEFGLYPIGQLWKESVDLLALLVAGAPCSSKNTIVMMVKGEKIRSKGE